MLSLRVMRTALHALRRNLMRSALTCIGIVIGVAAVIAMVEIGQGSSKMIEETIASVGASVLQVDPEHVVQAGVSTGTGGRATLTPADADAMRRECSAVRWVAPSVDCRTQVIHGNRNWSPNNILGTTPDYLLIRNWSVVEGEPFTEADVRSAASVCLVGQTIVQELFRGEPPVGKEIRVRNVTLRVIGVLAKKGANMMGRDQDDYVVAPWTTVKFRLSGSRSTNTPAPAAQASADTPSSLFPGRKPQLYTSRSAAQLANYPLMVRFSDLDDVWVSAQSPGEVPQAIRQITTLLRERHELGEGQPDDFRIRDLTEISQTVAATTQLVSKLLLIVAMISLVVGGVGIMNIMLVSVTERTREIGLRMAVGARGRDILKQFLVEAMLLCFAGGIVGIAVGRGASMAVTALLRWPTLPSAAAVAASVAVSVIVGVLFGFYPAWKASRLDPIEALRFE